MLFKLGIFFFSLALMSTFSVMGNVIVLNIYSKDIRIEKDMPKWVNFNIFFIIIF